MGIKRCVQERFPHLNFSAACFGASTCKCYHCGCCFFLARFHSVRVHNADYHHARLLSGSGDPHVWLYVAASIQSVCVSVYSLVLVSLATCTWCMCLCVHMHVHYVLVSFFYMLTHIHEHVQTHHSKMAEMSLL